MNRHVLFIPVIFFLLVSFVPRSASQEQKLQKPLYVATGNEASLIGTVAITGPIPARTRIDMSADPVCQELNKNKSLSQHILTSGNRLQNVFVYLKSGDNLTAYRYEEPPNNVELHHLNCWYSSRVFGMRLNQKLIVHNSDPTQHNTHPTPKLNPEWNQSQPAHGEPLVKTFSRAEVMIPIKCNQHPWERTSVGVMDHPFFAVSDESGNFEIKGIPPGKYTLVAWHERLGEQEIEVNLGPEAGRGIHFDFKNESDKR